MYCPKCGVENAENSIQCVSCGEPMPIDKVNLKKENEDSNINQKDNTNNNGATTINENIPKIESNMIWSILVTIFGAITCCCLNPVSIVTGIVSIAFASQVDEKVRIGDIEGAMKSAKTAKILNWVSLGCIILTILVIVILTAFSVIFSSDFSTEW